MTSIKGNFFPRTVIECEMINHGDLVVKNLCEKLFEIITLIQKLSTPQLKNLCKLLFEIYHDNSTIKKQCKQI